MENKKEDVQAIQQEMLELSIKAGRRLMHDFNHLLQEVPKENILLEDFKERASMWHSIFYPDDGMKNYRSELHMTITRQSIEIRRLEEILKSHGIDYGDPKKPF